MSPDPKQGGERNWDKELAEVDRLIAGLGGQPAAPPPVSQRAAPGAAGVLTEQRAAQNRRETLRTWLWFVLAAGLGAALQWWWPYSRACGWPLYGYLGAVGVFGVAAAWSTIQSWRTRSVVAHFLSVGLLFWATALGATEVLAREGYLQQSQYSWRCPAAPPANP